MDIRKILNWHLYFSHSSGKKSLVKAILSTGWKKSDTCKSRPEQLIYLMLWGGGGWWGLGMIIVMLIINLHTTHNSPALGRDRVGPGPAAQHRLINCHNQSHLSPGSEVTLLTNLSVVKLISYYIQSDLSSLLFFLSPFILYRLSARGNIGGNQALLGLVVQWSWLSVDCPSPLSEI